MVKLGLEPSSSHPSLVSGGSLKGHEHADADLGRNVYPSVKFLRSYPEGLHASEILRNGSQEKAGKERGSRMGWEGSQAGPWLQRQAQPQPDHM